MEKSELRAYSYKHDSIMQQLVFYTGAGMSRESGLPTFRGDEGLWDSLDVKAVADRRSWYCGRRADRNARRQVMLDFFNPIRRLILEKEPNEGHRLIAALERMFDVTVVTQNGDDFHERAGSSHVVHLHGQALRNASTMHPYESWEIDPANPDIRIGDKASDGSQIRPYVIFFGEEIERRLWKASVAAVRSTDILVVIGSTMLVHPAADLLQEVRPDALLTVIDPGEIRLPEGCCHPFTQIRCGAVEGMRRLYEQLTAARE